VQGGRCTGRTNLDRKKCVITMQLRGHRIDAKQKGTDFDCGFGHNVTMSGRFERVSTHATCPPEEN